MSTVRFKSILVAGCICAGLPASVGAVQVQATFEELTANSWRINYLIANDDLPSLREFTIFFAAETTQSMVLTSPAPPGWDILVVQPELAIPDDGFVDGLALDSGLAKRSVLAPLQITMATTAAFSVAPQRFEIRDPATFDLLTSGLTTVSVVPEPAPAALFMAGTLALGVRVRARSLTA